MRKAASKDKNNIRGHNVDSGRGRGGGRRATEPGLGHASRCHGFDVAAQGGERRGSSAFCVERAERESATRHEGCRGAVVLQTSVSVLLHVGTMFFSCLDDRGDLLAAVLQSFVCPCL